MRKQIIFGKSLLFSAALVLSFATFSCKENEKTVDPKEVAEKENEATLKEARELEQIAQIVVDVADFDLMQRELGKLGQAKGVSQGVKDIGSTVETHHNESFQEVRQYATSKGLTVPNAITNDGQKEYDRLSKLEGAEFDKEFLKSMQKHHKDGISVFRKDAGRTENAEINALLERQITLMQRHHDAVDGLLKNNQ